MREKAVHLMGEVKRVALATDGSEFSDGAVQEAIFFCQACKASLTIINVIGINTEVATSAHATSTTMRGEIKGYIENIVKMASDGGIESTIVVEESYQPEKTIVELAHKNNADLLIMGRHGRKGLLKLLVGSMTSKVIGLGFPHILVVPKDFSVTGKRLLVATDGSELSEMALTEAVNMSEHCASLKEIYVLSVAKQEEGLEEARERAENTCQRAKEKGMKSDCQAFSAVGRPSEVISNFASEKGIDIILMGGHGKGLSKLLMGHVTEKVIGRAHCAVLVVDKFS